MTRAILSTAAALAAGVLATAAPVPKLPPPPAPKTAATVNLCVAKVVDGGQLEVSSTQTVQKAITVSVEVERNGQKVTEQRVEYVTESVPVTYRMVIANTRCTTADGKEVAADDLAKRLGDGGPVVQVYQAMDPEWKKLFADDVIFLDQSVALPRAGVVGRPAMIRPLPAVAPPPPVIEKK